MRPLNGDVFVKAKLALAGAGVIAVAWISLSGCASSGFYQMSGEWGTRNPAASSARCHRNPSDLVLVGRTNGSQHQSNGSQQQAEQELSTPLPVFILGAHCARARAPEPYAGPSGAR